MPIYKEKQIFGQKCEDGIWLDFQDNTWLFFVKDRVWQPEEIQRTKRSDVTIEFIQKGISDAFLLEVYDCIEMSDLPFCIKEADEDVLRSLKGNAPYQYEIVLINAANEICAVRSGIFTKENTEILKKRLLARNEENFTSEDAENSYAKLSSRFQPYELEDFAVFKQRN
jgi:hypothetical protein